MAITGTGQDGSALTSEQKDSLAQALRETTYRRLDDQKTRATESLGSFAGEIRSMSGRLREGGQGPVADYIDKSADWIEQWSSALQQKDLAEAVRAVEQFARRQPALFLGIAFTAGVVAARVLKSSADNGATSGSEDRTTGAGPMGTTDFGARQPGTVSTDIPRISSDMRSAGEVI